MVSGKSPSFLVHRWLAFCCVLTWWKGQTRELPRVSFIRTVFPFMGLCPYDLTTFQRPHFLMQSHWGSGFQHTNLGGGSQTFRLQHGLCGRSSLSLSVPLPTSMESSADYLGSHQLVQAWPARTLYCCSGRLPEWSICQDNQLLVWLQ